VFIINGRNLCFVRVTDFKFIDALDIGGGGGGSGVENVIIFFPLWHTNYGIENNVYDG